MMKKSQMHNRRALLTMLAVGLLVVGCAASPTAVDYRAEVGVNGFPTPRALFTKYIDAIGGESIIRSHESTTMKGKFVLEDFGLEGSASIYLAAPNQLSQVIIIPGFGEIRTGYNGNVGWSVDPMQGNSLLAGEMLADMIQQSDYYLPLNLANAYVEQETVELTQVLGDDAHKVRAVGATGKETMMYFGVDSGQLLRVDMVVASPIGNVNVFTMFSEFRNFDGQTLPTDLSISQSGQQFKIVFDEISFDDVAQSRFDVPVEIEPLL